MTWHPIVSIVTNRSNPFLYKHQPFRVTLGPNKM